MTQQKHNLSMMVLNSTIENLIDEDQKQSLVDMYPIYKAAPDLLEALIAAVDCGMVPTSSISDGGANKHSIQVKVADQIRAAISKATGE